MGYKLFDPSPYPSVNMSVDESFKILTSNYGDNYSQDAGDGINSTADTAKLAWDNLTMAEYQTILNFIKARNGTTPFYFQLPGVVYWQKWKCKAFSRTFLSGQNVSFQATFNECFDIDTNVVSGYAGVPGSALYNSLGVPVVDPFGNYVLTS